MTDNASEYCIRCDQPGPTSEMDPLYTDPADANPSWWVHIKCRNTHERLTVGAQMKAMSVGIQARFQSEASEPVVNLTHRRALSELANTSSAVAEKIETLEAMRAELELRGIDPDKGD